MSVTLPDVPPGGFTVESFEALDGELPHFVELVEGCLVVTAAQRSWHSWAIRKLAQALEEQIPFAALVLSEVGVRVGEKSRPEPDVLVLRRAAADPDAASYEPRDVLLAVEVLSPESTDRDRHSKPRLYAQAGIQHFWRVEREDHVASVYTNELDATTGAYVATGIHRGKLTTNVPWPLVIDLTQLFFT